jgi:hypothetical protein
MIHRLFRLQSHKLPFDILRPPDSKIGTDFLPVPYDLTELQFDLVTRVIE